MQVTILSDWACPICAYRNTGIQVGDAQPLMRGLRLRAGSLLAWPWQCQECGQRLGADRPDRTYLDAASDAKLQAWRQRQRDRRKRRVALRVNVRCQREIAYPFQTPSSAPCGWKGQRTACGGIVGQYCTNHGFTHKRDPRLWKSCPRCGGRVELIPIDGENP